MQPYLNGTLDFNGALTAGSVPLQHFMLAHTREEDIALMTRAAGMENPATPEAVPLQTLIPAFMISELRAAFIIGFVIFIPFLVIDLVVSAALMSMGMMMLPPVMISLPFKILLFVLVDGWGLIITSLIQSYAGTRMNANAVLDICLQAMIVAAKLSAPVLVTALVVGLAISLLQSITQLQEATLSFVPKLAAVAVALLICGHWMISEMVAFTNDLFAKIPCLLGGM